MTTTPKNFLEARAQFAADKASLEESGIYAMDSKVAYIPQGVGTNFALAMDAQSPLITSPSSGIPSFLSAMVDPQVYRIVLAPNKAVEILGEVRSGDWTKDLTYFPTVESTGEVSAYGDYNNNGLTGVNTSFPQRQSFLFQTIKRYGDLEVARAGLAKINYVAEIDRSASTTLNKFSNYSYHFGVAGLQNYGLLNDPGIAQNPTLTPAPKANGGTKWMNGVAMNASANEVFADIQSLISQAINQANGNVDSDSKMKLALAQALSNALNITNIYGISVKSMLAQSYPNLTVVYNSLYNVQSSQNPFGLVGGNMIQLIVEQLDGQDTGYCAYNEKLREHKPVFDMSAWRQKVTGGTWGAVIRIPACVAQMIGA